MKRTAAVTTAQNIELAKYENAYIDPKYHMSEERRGMAAASLAELPWRSSYLDVSCGCGEMLKTAGDLNFEVIRGTETVEDLIGGPVAYALGWDLPFRHSTFEVVSLFDVIEHLLPGDDEPTCRELARVASKAVLISANNERSVHKGVELHVNRRPYEEWDELFRAWFPGKVRWLRQRAAKRSQMWRIELGEKA